MRAHLLAAVALAVVLGVAAVGFRAERGPGALGTFGSSGIVRTDFGGDDRLSAVVVQNDGRIVAVGGRGSAFAVARYLRSGHPDPTFGKGGKVVTDVGLAAPASGSAAGAVGGVAQRDGKIVVVGGNRQFVLVRYLRDGRLDPTFGTQGVVRTSFGSKNCGQAFQDEPFALALQPDGKIVAAGRSCDDIALVRYTTAGRLDPTFGKSGELVSHLGWDDFSDVEGVVVRHDGRLVADVGVCCHLGEAVLIVRFTGRGVVDRSFGTRGQTIFSLADQNIASALALQSDGKIIIAGTGMYTSQPPAGSPWTVFGLVRLTPAGRLDASFGKRGKTITDGDITSLALQADGKILVAGAHSLARYTGAGQSDADFVADSEPLALFSAGTGLKTALAVQPDGNIIVAGSAGKGRTHDFMLVRYRRDGSLDRM